MIVNTLKLFELPIINTVLVFVINVLTVKIIVLSITTPADIRVVNLAITQAFVLSLLHNVY